MYINGFSLRSEDRPEVPNAFKKAGFRIWGNRIGNTISLDTGDTPDQGVGNSKPEKPGNGN
jgi:hypothetical protein